MRSEGHGELADAGDDGPGADPDRQRQGGDARPGDGDDAGGDVEEGEQEMAGNGSRLLTGEGPATLVNCVDEDGDRKDDHHRGDGHPRPQDGNDADGDGQQTAPEQ